MASRFGRKKRAKMRAEMASAMDAIRLLAAENYTLADKAIHHAQAYNSLAERVAAWDEEICYHLGKFSALRLSPATLDTKHSPDTLHRWPVTPRLPAFIGAADVVPDVVQHHADRLFHVLVDASDKDAMNYQRLISMRIRAADGEKLAHWVYAIGERSLDESKRMGRHHIDFLAKQIAEKFRERMVKEMGR